MICYIYIRSDIFNNVDNEKINEHFRHMKLVDKNCNL